MSTTQSTTTSSKTTVKSSKPAMGKSAPSRTTTGKFVTPEQRYNMIAEAAYFIAEKRGFSGGDSSSDWACAETEIDRMLTNQ
ncbi:MAG TPA: DUF2934 domain-containing protein [Gammaproteobacteria bacterium]